MLINTQPDKLITIQIVFNSTQAVEIKLQLIQNQLPTKSTVAGDTKNNYQCWITSKETIL